jgi:hypothetical protein
LPHLVGVDGLEGGNNDVFHGPSQSTATGMELWLPVQG